MELDFGDFGYFSGGEGLGILAGLFGFFFVANWLVLGVGGGGLWVRGWRSRRSRVGGLRPGVAWRWRRRLGVSGEEGAGRDGVQR